MKIIAGDATMDSEGRTGSACTASRRHVWSGVLWLPRIVLTLFRRYLPVLRQAYIGQIVWTTGLCALGAMPILAIAQATTRIQYMYDSAGNLLRATRSAINADLTVTNLVIGAVALNGNGSYDIPVTFQVNNVGSGPALATWYDRGYLSLDTALDDADQVLSGGNTRSTDLSSGGSYVVSAGLTTSTMTAPGTYTLIVKADGGQATAGQLSPTGANLLAEVNEANNTQSTSIKLPPNKPDLSVTGASVGALSVSQGGAYSIPIAYTVTNGGFASANPNWYDLAYLSSDGTLDSADQNLGGYVRRSTSLEPGASYTVTKTYATTGATAPGSYTLFMKTDGRGSAIGTGSNSDSGYLVEGAESNNAQAIALTLPAKPDLSLSNVSVGSIGVNANGSRSLSVTFTVTNVGGTPAAPSFYTMAYLSADGTLDNADQNLGGSLARTTALAVGASYTATRAFTTSTSTPAGPHTLFLKADGHGATVTGTNTDNGQVAESDETNNVVGLPVMLP